MRKLPNHTALKEWSNVIDAIARGEQVVLFTNLANPTSNAIYQRIGFRPVGDHRVVRFVSER